MEELLKQFVGKEIDVAFGTNYVVRGEVREVRDGMVYLEDEDKRSVYIAIDKISVVWEVKAAHSRPGFVISPGISK
jgi:ribosome maturation factor RimP